MTKLLILGTAQWGWTVTPPVAFSLLDQWLKSGNRRIDCATNYPINRNPADFRAAEHILNEYINAHGLQDLQVTMKVGSLDNMRSPEANLSPSFIQMMAEEYLRMLGTNLECVMIHWDNREDVDAIAQSLEALSRVQHEHGIRPGLSGIKKPDTYKAANQPFGLTFDIQVKHNVLQSDLSRYLPDFSSSENRFFAYGINAGGIKLGGLPYPSDSTFLARGGQPEQVSTKLQGIASLLLTLNKKTDRPAIQSMNQLGMICACLNPNLKGILLGVNSAVQLSESLVFWDELKQNDYSDVWASL